MTGMTGVVSDLLGKLVAVKLRRYDENTWLHIVSGRVRAVSQRDGSEFGLLLEVNAHGGETSDLWHLSHPELPHRALLSISSSPSPANYSGTIAIVPTEEPTEAP